MFPTDGIIGYLWNDSFYPGHTHQGIDVFGGNEPGTIPVKAVYSGFLYRLPQWKSSLIILIPQDPLKPERQIWTYYTHMADAQGRSFIVAEFQPGTEGVYVQAGTLLGYQGDYSGKLDRPTGVHLHFSIVLDDGDGHFRNELKIENTLDPSAYFGLPLNADEKSVQPPVCEERQ